MLLFLLPFFFLSNCFLPDQVTGEIKVLDYGWIMGRILERRGRVRGMVARVSMGERCENPNYEAGSQVPIPQPEFYCHDEFDQHL